MQIVVFQKGAVLKLRHKHLPNSSPPFPLSKKNDYPTDYFHQVVLQVPPSLPSQGVNFINAKSQHLKYQIMAFKLQKWRLTFIKSHKMWCL